VEQQKKSVDGEDVFDLSVRDKLTTLFSLQTIDTRIDRIRVIRGELPLEVQDLEDEVAGLQTRCQNIIQEVEDVKEQSNQQKLFIKDCIALIKKYEEQQNNVRNNREFDSLNKEIQYQKLEIEHSEKKINDYAKMVESKTQIVEDVKIELEDRIQDLDEKKAELNDIISETQVDEKMLLDKREFFEKKIDERLLYSYSRLRKNARNGLAVASIERDACGGCFNKIPLQRQFEIKQHKKIIVCEYCGRILVDDSIVNTVVIE
jgi:predicted  nucleic acid-binding Zn-ribbon protein